MITLYVGDDLAKKALYEATDAYVTKNPSIPYFRAHGEDEELEKVRSYLEQHDLFSEKKLLIFISIFEQIEKSESLFPQLDKTIHDVILFESKIPKGIEEYFLSTKSKLNIIEKKDKAEKNPFSSPTIFDLADAYAKGDKRTAWSEYEKAMRNGSAPEEIHGTLVWAAKSLWLSHNFDETTNMAMGVKPFVYRKFSKFGAAWNKEALLVALSELKHIYHKAHRGEGDLEILLEQHILSLRTK